MQSFVGQHLARLLAKGIRERSEILLAKTEPCRHFVPAKFFQKPFATLQRLHHRKTIDAPPAAFARPARIESNHNRWPMVFSRETRSDDSEHARMPASCSNHNRSVPLRFKRCRDLLIGGGADFPFHCLPLAILRIE